MFYDSETNLISIELTKGKIDHVVELGNFLLHVNKNKTPLIIEILDGGKFIAQLNKAKAKKLADTIVATT